MYSTFTIYIYFYLFQEEQTKEIFCVCCGGCVGEITDQTNGVREETNRRNKCVDGNKIVNSFGNWAVGL